MDKNITVTVVCSTCGHTNNILQTQKQDLYSCECCDHLYPIPKNIEKYSSLYAQATVLRCNNQFDQAIDIYDQILNQDEGNEEAHFGIAMCRYGVNYVKDDDDYMLTCWRYQGKSIVDDYNYQRAIALANPRQAGIYRAKAKEVNRIQRRIYRIIQEGTPYDVFLCCMENDDSTGLRTTDSHKAEELYDALTAKGYRVFFSRRTFQSTLAEEYEPYIYAALYTAKFMYVLASSREHVESKWVKNEWTRFIELKKDTSEKALRVLLLNMQPEELPAELGKYQAFDINRIGIFEQLCTELETKNIKLFKTNDLLSQNTQNQNSQPCDAMIARGYNYLQTEEYDYASKYFDNALNIDEKKSQAYWGLLLAMHQCPGNEELIMTGICIDQESNYRFACKYADSAALVQYQKCADMSLLFGHAYIMALIRNGDIYRASLRAENYASSSLCDSQLVEIHQALIGPKAFAELSAETASILHTLLKIYKSDSRFAELEAKFGFVTMAEKDYHSYMSRILTQINDYWTASDNLTQLSELADIWANPCEKKEHISDCFVDEQEPRTIGERYLYLAEHFQMTKDIGYETWIPMLRFTFACYRHAYQYGADKDICTRSRQNFYDNVLKAARQTEPLEILKQEFPEDWRLYWKYFELYHRKADKDLFPKLPPKAALFLERPFELEQDGKKITAQKQFVQSLEYAIQKCSKFPQKHSEELQPYLEAALSYAGNHRLELQNEWEAYFLALKEHCEKETFQLTKLLNQVRKKIDDEARRRIELQEEAEKRYKRSIRREKITNIAICLFVILSLGYIVIQALQSSSSQDSLPSSDSEDPSVYPSGNNSLSTDPYEDSSDSDSPFTDPDEDPSDSDSLSTDLTESYYQEAIYGSWRTARREDNEIWIQSYILNQDGTFYKGSMGYDNTAYVPFPGESGWYVMPMGFPAPAGTFTFDGQELVLNYYADEYNSYYGQDGGSETISVRNLDLDNGTVEFDGITYIWDDNTIEEEIRLLEAICDRLGVDYSADIN